MSERNPSRKGTNRHRSVREHGCRAMPVPGGAVPHRARTGAAIRDSTLVDRRRRHSRLGDRIGAARS